MKKLILAALIAGGFSFAAPARAAAPVQETRQSWEDFRIKARTDLDVLEDKIEMLEREAKSAGAGAQDRLRARAQALRGKKTDADRMMEQLGTATTEARRDLQPRLDRALSDLKAAVREAEAKRDRR